MYLIVDRMTEAGAVCEDEKRQMLQVKAAELPPGTKEGDCLFRDEDGSLIFSQEETERRRQEASRLLRELFND